MTPVSDTKSVKPMVVIVVIADKTRGCVAGSHKSLDFLKYLIRGYSGAPRLHLMLRRLRRQNGGIPVTLLKHSYTVLAVPKVVILLHGLKKISLEVTSIFARKVAPIGNRAK